MFGSSSTTSTRGARVTVFSPFVHRPRHAERRPIDYKETRMTRNRVRRTTMNASLDARRIALGVPRVWPSASCGCTPLLRIRVSDPPPFSRADPAGRAARRAGPVRRTGRTDGHAADARPRARPDRRADASRSRAIADSHKDEWKALGDRARTAHDALNDAVTADTFDEAADPRRRAPRSRRSTPTWPSRGRARTPRCCRS